MVSLDHPHADVINKELGDNKESNMRLRDEVRNRATGAFQCGDMQSAEHLYTKAIEIHPDATMYSNRSMVRLKMGRNELAAKDAEEAMKLDPSFIKAYYRKAVALKRLGEFDQALETCKKDVVKSVPEMTALITEIEQERKKADVEKAALKAEAEDLTVKRPIPEPTRIPVPAPKRTTPKDDEKSDKDKPVKKDLMRGYKTTEDGKVTSYFHTEISEEAKQLIGDRRPQKIDPPVVAADTNGDEGTKLKSAWNENTFEARGFNKWVEKKVGEVFPLKHSLHNGEFECVCSYTSFEGDLEIVTMRGKPRVINNVSYTFNLKLYNKDEEQIAEGTLKYHNDGNGEYDSEYTNTTVKPEAQQLISTYIRKEGSVIQNAVLKKIEGMMADFRATEAKGL